MNWEAIGALGEIFGAIAVIATLAYLAVQVRQNTKALNSATFQEISTTTALNNEPIALNPDIAELVFKARNGLSDLTEIEKIRFGALALSSVRRIEPMFIQEKLGAIDSSFTKGFRKSGLSAFTQPAIREWWEDTKEAFSDDFRDIVDEAIKSGDIKPLHRGIGKLDNSDDDT